MFAMKAVINIKTDLLLLNAVVSSMFLFMEELLSCEAQGMEIEICG